jgi:thiol-disulfide isomerase/thioredoxin
VLLQREREVAEQYQAYGTPAAVAIAPDGRVASHVAQGGEAIRNLVLTIQAGELPPLPAQVETLRVGEPAPELTFKTVAGEEFALSGLRGTATLLLFWNQGCGFCQQMLPDLKAWEATGPPPAAPRLVVVSSGSAADNSTLNLQSAVVLDEGSRAAQAFGATGTPMAVLLDGEGRVASQVAAGAQEVFALANREVPPGGNGRVTATVG